MKAWIQMNNSNPTYQEADDDPKLEFCQLNLKVNDYAMKLIFNQDSELIITIDKVKKKHEKFLQAKYRKKKKEIEGNDAYIEGCDKVIRS
jgi:hypothetical protein